MTNSPDRGPSRDRRREQALAQRVGDALDELTHRDAAECPDAELIAAYHEKSLQSDETARWESHFAICARCRKVLQVLAASADAPLDEKEVARLGKLVAAARSPHESPAQAAKPAGLVRLHWRKQWLAPALGVAAVLAVWFAMRPPWHTAEQNPAATLIAQSPKSELPLSMQARPRQPSLEVTPRKNTETDPEVLSDRAKRTTESRSLRSDSPRQGNTDAGGVAREIAPASGAAEDDLREKKQRADSSAAPAEAITRPAPAEAYPQDTMQAPADTAPPGSANRAATAAGASPQVETSARALSGSLSDSKAKGSPINGRNFQSLQEPDRKGVFRVPVNGASGKVLWRAGTGGDIERSADAGQTWTSQTSPLHEDWLAGAAVSDSICWIVGRNGAIARTIDGSHWEKIGPPPGARERSGKLPDWNGISAVDANNVTIMAGERRFATQDAGKSWMAQ